MKFIFIIVLKYILNVKFQKILLKSIYTMKTKINKYMYYTI